MPRIPYLPQDLTEPRELVSAIRKRRGGALIELDRMLLNSPPFARGWNAHLLEVRTGLTLSAKLRELAICVVAILNGANYEWSQHKPLLAAAGASEAQLQALSLLANDSTEAGADAGSLPAGLFDAAERAAIQLTVEMTRNVKVSDATFNAVKNVLPNNQQVAEIIGVIATYNMVSRFLVALGIDEE